MRRREPQPLRVGEAVEQVHVTAAGERRRRRRRGRRRTARCVSPTRLAGLDQPQPAGQLGREVDHDGDRRRAGGRRPRRGPSPRCSRRAQSPARRNCAEVGEAGVHRRRRRRATRAAARRRGRGRALRAVRALRARDRARSRAQRRGRRLEHGGHDTDLREHGTRPLGWSPSIRATSPGTTALGQRPVGDVLAGERVLVHLGAHVAGVDDEHPQVGLLGREHRPTAARARPSTSRSRPSPRRPRPRRRT